MEVDKKNTLSFPILKSEDQSLRVVRVLNKGETLYAEINCYDCDDQHLDFLEDCCTMLRNMGSNRTRGWGEVKCILKKEPSPINKNIEFKSIFNPQPLYGDLKAASYQILLTEAVISSLLSGGVGCEGHLPGSMLLGYFAGLWVKAHSSGPDDMPHKNPEFRRLFLEGKVIFGSAYPTNLEYSYYPTPLSIKTNKTGDIIHDDANAKADKDEATTTKLGGYVHKNSKCLYLIKPTFNVALHHARPYDRSIGHAKEGNNARDGAFFSYTALAPEQLFCGDIIGTCEDLAILKNLLPELEPTIRLGRSRSAQYGNAKFKWHTYRGEDANRYITIEPNAKVRVIVRSPLILCNKDGTITPCPKLLADKLGLDMDEAFVSETLVAGYNAKWLLPRQQMGAIQAGSVVVLENSTTESIVIEKEQFLGLRKGEGFGHVYVEDIPHDGKLSKPTLVKYKHKPTDKFGNDLNERIKLKMQKRQYEQKARDDKSITMNNAPTSAQLGRLLGLLRGKRGTIDSTEELRCIINEEWKNSKKIDKIKEFCRLNDDDQWDFYKVWLLAAINKVQLERRAEQ
jgi:CRISPR-associated protein Csx10